MPAPPSKPPDRQMIFLGQTLRDIRAFPEEVRREVGYALDRAQKGLKHSSAKPLSGDKAFKSAKILEIVEDDDGNTYRAVYTAKFEGAVYVLHAFQKKSKQGIATPRKELETIKGRLVDAAKHFERHLAQRDSA